MGTSRKVDGNGAGLDETVAVLDLVRSGAAHTKPELSRAAGLGRNVVTDRVEQLLHAGLLVEDGVAASTGGRAPRGLRFRADAGHVLVADLGASHLTVGYSDLRGELVGVHREPCDIALGPVPVLARVSELFRELLAAHRGPLWGIGVGVPGPVEFARGVPVAPPIMPGWDEHDVRGHLAERFDVPVWVDNDVNITVLGELRAGAARNVQDVVFVKVGTGVGAGLISGGRLHRGAQGGAGDIGHVAAVRDLDVRCRCGQFGCLEAFAGGWAILRGAHAAAARGDSPLLARVLDQGRPLALDDVGIAAGHGDAVAVDLLTTSGQLVGEALARIVNFFNPSLVLLGGSVPGLSDRYLATVRQVVLSRSLPLATRSLRLEPSPLGQLAALKGGAFLVIDELLSRELLGRWIRGGSPAGRLDLLH